MKPHIVLHLTSVFLSNQNQWSWHNERTGPGHYEQLDHDEQGDEFPDKPYPILWDNEIKIHECSLV